MSLSTESLAVLSRTASIARNHSEEDVFSDLFHRHRQMVYRVCLRYLGHHHDAEDVTQETFRRAAQAMPDLDFRRPIEPWLVTIAANRCRTLLSGRRHERTICPLDDESAIPRVQPDVAQQFALGEQIDYAMQRLPEHQRRAFELVHQSELSYPEAAGMMGRSTGTIKTWVRRAKLAMRDTLSASDGPRVESWPVHASAIDSAFPSNSASSSNSASAKEPSTTGRAVAARWIASAILMMGLYAAGQESLLSSLTLNRSEAENSTGSTQVAMALPAAAPETALSKSSSAVDWQLVSLDRLSRAEFSIEQIRSLPVTDWVDRSSPTINHLRQGIAPLGNTLHRVVLLFQCDVASLETPSPSLRTCARQPNDSDNANSLNASLIDSVMAMQSLATIT